MTYPRILVAGIGNIFLGDDGFGVEVTQRLAKHSFPSNVRVTDFGIRGFDLAYAMLEDYDATILVDAAPRGGRPGTLYVIEPDLTALDNLEQVELLTHNTNPLQVFALVKQFGGHPRGVRVVGCEPETFGPVEGKMGLSEAVAASVDPAVELVESLVHQFQQDV